MIEDPPLLTIKRRFERPAAEIIAAFSGVPVGQVVDAMGGRGALHHAIKPVSPDAAALVGIAVTCHCGPADNLAVFGALDAAVSGDIIVAATDGFAGTAVIGDLVLGMARNKGLAGFVTDGLVRDVVGIEAVGLPVYCAGVIAELAGAQRSRHGWISGRAGRRDHRTGRHTGRRPRRRRGRAKAGGRGSAVAAHRRQGGREGS